MELEFSLSELNKKSPYELASLGDYSFKFVTDQGKQYTIGFIEDAMISDNGVYQFFIKTEDQFKTIPPKDPTQLNGLYPHFVSLVPGGQEPQKGRAN